MMSASELIERLKALPAGERRTFARLFHQLETGDVTAADNGAKGRKVAARKDWPDFDARLKRIYGNKRVADSEAVLAYARGDW